MRTLAERQLLAFTTTFLAELMGARNLLHKLPLLKPRIDIPSHLACGSGSAPCIVLNADQLMLTSERTL